MRRPSGNRPTGRQRVNRREVLLATRQQCDGCSVSHQRDDCAAINLARLESSRCSRVIDVFGGFALPQTFRHGSDPPLCQVDPLRSCAEGSFQPWAQSDGKWVIRFGIVVHDHAAGRQLPRVRQQHAAVIGDGLADDYVQSLAEVRIEPVVLTRGGRFSRRRRSFSPGARRYVPLDEQLLLDRLLRDYRELMPSEFSVWQQHLSLLLTLLIRIVKDTIDHEQGGTRRYSWHRVEPGKTAAERTLADHLALIIGVSTGLSSWQIGASGVALLADLGSTPTDSAPCGTVGGRGCGGHGGRPWVSALCSRAWRRACLGDRSRARRKGWAHCEDSGPDSVHQHVTTVLP
jgi:hypothetical protein